jgi:hypothetical protein
MDSEWPIVLEFEFERFDKESADLFWAIEKMWDFDGKEGGILQFCGC